MNIIKFTIKENDTLLNFLLSHINNKSKNNIKSLLINGNVSVNDVVIKDYSYKLNINDDVKIYTNQIRDNVYRNRINIIYEDSNIIVIDKPSGLLPIATLKEKRFTAYNIVMNYIKKKNKNNKLFIIHRLDKDTSGVLMFAKSERIKNIFQDSWNDIVLNREYLGIVEGKLKEKNKTITSYLIEDNFNKVYSTEDKSNGKQAITHYKVIKQNSKFSMLRINIDTGRKNQIRVHMKDIGSPIVGDKKYGSKLNPIKRLGLHAKRLKFVNPLDNKTMEFVSPIPNEFINIFK